MEIFSGHLSAGILVLNQVGGVTNQLYEGQTPGDFTVEGVVLDSSFRAGEQRGPNVEIALYGSNCEVTVAGAMTQGLTLWNGKPVNEGNYNAMVVKTAGAGFSIVRLVNGFIAASQTEEETA